MTPKPARPDDLREVLFIVGRDVEIRNLLNDEHLRYELYVDALSLVSSEKDEQLIDIVLRDADPVMREAALGAFVDRVASSRSTESFGRWYEARQTRLSSSKFASQRAKEWLTYKDVMEGRHVPSVQYLEASDWLQRKLGEDSTASEVLESLAEGGRTKRIRGIAKDRLSQARRRGGHGGTEAADGRGNLRGP